MLSKILENSLRFFGPFYLYLGFGAVILMFVLLFLPMSKKVIGNQRPDSSWFSWVAMLFSTGMGPGLLLRAVQEPGFYYLHPPKFTNFSTESLSFAYTFFHWGLTPWAFYGLFGLIMILPSVNHKLNISSFFDEYNISETAKKIIDTTLITCTVVGVIASLGLGSKQIAGGLSFLSNNEETSLYSTILILISLITVGTFSAISGLKKSIKNLSNFNIGLMLFFLIFVSFQSPILSLCANLLNGLKIYFIDFVGMSLNLGDKIASDTFMMDWTYFYWAFWLAWVPFTGIFIARISKGRTIRQYILGTLLIPSIGTFLWFNAFGTLLFTKNQTELLRAGYYESIYNSIFRFFNEMPFGLILSPILLVLAITFLITSIDSGIFVLSIFSSKQSEPTKKHRIFWGIFLGVFTTILLAIGGDSLLGIVSQILILFAMPFSILYLIMIVLFVFRLVQKK